MNIVWLTPEIPYPPIGGRNGVYNRIVQLSKYNNIYLFSIAYSEEEVNSSKLMEQYCVEVHYYNRFESKFKNLFKSITMPFSVATRYIDSLRMDLEHVLNENVIDVIIDDFPNMSKNLTDIIGKKKIYCTLNQHNIEYLRMRGMVNVNTIPLYKRLAYYLESYRLEAYEKYIYDSGIFNSITFFSQDDLKLFQDRWGNDVAKLELFPLGANRIDENKEFDGNHTLLFVGRLDDIAIPNVEAVRWFCDKVFPFILGSVPDAKLIIAGANPSEVVMSYASDNIEIIPNYKDILEIYSKSDCVILPILSGGGVKGKLLEAVAMKKIIISTNHGIEGTKFENGKHVLYGVNEKDFGLKCIDAMCHKENYKDMVSDAYSLFLTDYEWESIGRKYHQFLLKETNGYYATINSK